MTRSFSMKLVNGRYGDPALYLRCVWEKRALLFDLGDISSLRPSEILKISDVFVSHTHVDHFIGFDHLLRTMLNRDKTVRFFGPEGLIDNVAGKLAGYTWNLIDDYRLNLVVTEVCEDGARSVTFSCRDRFRRRSAARDLPAPDPLLKGERFEVKVARLDHSVPCLGFALEERLRVSINKDRLEKRGWAPGPWLNEVKKAVLRKEPADIPVTVPLKGGDSPGTCRLSLEEVVNEIVRTEKGAKIAYVTDISFSAANVAKVIELAAGADCFYCEAAFLERDLDHAKRKNHLTARQAGELARRSGARRLEIFHFSPKYLGEEELMLGEARQARLRGGDGSPTAASEKTAPS